MYIRHHKGAAETNGSIIETSHFVFVWRFGCVDRWLECYRNVVSIFLYVHLASKGLKHGTTKTNFSPSGIGSVVKPRSIGSTHAGDHAQRMDCADGFVQCVVGGNHIKYVFDFDKVVDGLFMSRIFKRNKTVTSLRLTNHKFKETVTSLRSPSHKSFGSDL